MSDFQVIRRVSHPATARVEKDFAELILGGDVTGEERDILATVMENPDANIEVAVPENIETDDLCRYIEACTKAYRRVGMAQRKLTPILGRLFILVQYRKDVQLKFGCDSFTQFMEEFVPRNLKINRNDAYACLRIAREFPQITPNAFDKLTIAKLKAIARAIPYNKGSISDREMQTRNQLVETAKEKNYEALIFHMHDMGLVDKDIAMPSKIVVRTNEHTKDRWEKLAKDPRIHSYVGSSDEGAILGAMISECHATWAIVEQANE